MNSEEDMLDNAVSNLSPSGDFNSDKFYVELIYRPLILDNITNWGIFNDNKHIKNFLHLEYTFKRSIINDEHHEGHLQASTLEGNPKYNNTMPKNIFRLEKLFDLQDKFKILTNTKKSISSLRYEAINLNVEQNPQTINLGTNCTHVERADFMKLFKEYKDSFMWTYKDLKTCDMKII